MPSFFSLIATAFRFYKKQPVLNTIVFWLLFIPQSVIDAMINITDRAIAQGFSSLSDNTTNGVAIAIASLIAIFLVYFMVWGQACVLLVGKRIISSPAGRSRTSFKAVRSQARKFIGPLLLTSIIRTVLCFLLCILAIIPLAFIDKLPIIAFRILLGISFVPALVFFLHTAFYDIIIVSGKSTYFAALSESNAVVQKRTLRTLFYFLGFGIVLIVPPSLVEVLATLATETAPVAALPVQILSNAIYSYALMFFMLTSIAFYKAMKSTAS